MADTKQQWYKDAKYGLFIHWGLYSILAGEWKDPKTGEVTKTDRIAEWIENNLNIDKEDYRKLKAEFHPDKFDADMFVKRAKEQWGVKYIVLTSKHHEGFAMYDSKVSDFNVVKAAGRDILRELSDACKKYDMTMGMRVFLQSLITKRSLQQISLPVMYRTHSFSMAEAVQESM